MSTPFLASLMAVSFNFAPKGWALANGQTLAINQNQALFSLLGTTFGGNGQTNFQLPNLQAATPVGMGNSFVLGQVGGEANHTLTINEVPAHTHTPQASSSQAGSSKLTGNSLAPTAGNLTIYGPAQNLVAMPGASIANQGGSQPHNNTQPYLTINWIIALQGIFPSPN